MECLEVKRKLYFKAEGLNLLARSDYIITEHKIMITFIDKSTGTKIEISYKDVVQRYLKTNHKNRSNRIIGFMMFLEQLEKNDKLQFTHLDCTDWEILLWEISRVAIDKLSHEKAA